MSVIAPGNVAVITGGASGIGLALAARLTEAGADVATGSPLRVSVLCPQVNPTMFGAG